MTSARTLFTNGHKLVATSVNPQQRGEPIFLLHGITASINFWGRDQLSLFSQYGPTYSLSLPGHYPAEFPANLPASAINAQTMGCTIANTIRQITGERPVTLVGHSTGGFAALSAAIFAPELVSRVVSISGFAQGRWTGALGLGQKAVKFGPLGRLLVKTSIKASRLNRSVFRSGWRFHVARPESLSDYHYLDPLVDQFYPDYRRLDLDAMVKFFKVMPQIDISPQLPQITAATLALSGDKDPTVPVLQSRLIAQRVPNAQLNIINGGGHFLFLEHPAEYHRILNQWLRKTEPVYS